MALYDIRSKLAEAIIDHPSLIPVIDRFGISLGVGDKTIGTVCAEMHIQPDFFVSVVNTFINEEYFPTNAMNTFSLEMTIDYLRKTAYYYREVQLPNIARHFKSLVARSGTDNNLHHLEKFFMGMKQQLEGCLDKEECEVFGPVDDGSVRVGIESVVADYAEAEERLHDLLTFFVVHLQGIYDSNLCTAVVSAVFSLKKDLRQNNRIRQRILMPMLGGEKQRQT